jgi:hypothetical protein
LTPFARDSGILGPNLVADAPGFPTAACHVVPLVPCGLISQIN